MTEVEYVYEVGEIKERVPIEVAAAEVGVVFAADGRALCPFHDDHNNPNFELMGPGEDGFEWAYCRACGAAVDVIELVRRVEGIEFYECLLKLSKLADELPEEVRAAEPRERRTLVPDQSWEDRLVECQARAYEHSDVGLLSYAYGFVGDDTPQPDRARWDEHLIGWGWGLDEAANVVIPHRDPLGVLTAVKMRYRDKSWKTFGALKNLYGCWRLVEDAHSVLLCEGESDCVWADAQRMHRLDVLSLPAGAGKASDDWIAQLARYEVVYLGMDEDVAGREAVDRWSEDLGYEPMSVRRVSLSEGEDLRSCGRTLAELLTDAREVG